MQEKQVHGQVHGNAGNKNACKPEGERKTAHLHVDCLSEEKNAWVKAAQKSEQGKLARWVRHYLNKAAYK